MFYDMVEDYSYTIIQKWITNLTDLKIWPFESEGTLTRPIQYVLQLARSLGCLGLTLMA